MTREEQIERLSRAPDWRAALLILSSDRFSEDGRVWNNVDLEDETIFFSTILKDGTFSSGEMSMLRIAASLFSTDEAINLFIELGGLDERNRALAIRAIATYCSVAVEEVLA